MMRLLLKVNDMLLEQCDQLISELQPQIMTAGNYE